MNGGLWEKDGPNLSGYSSIILQMKQLKFNSSRKL